MDQMPQNPPTQPQPEPPLASAASPQPSPVNPSLAPTASTAPIEPTQPALTPTPLSETVKQPEPPQSPGASMSKSDSLFWLATWIILFFIGLTLGMLGKNYYSVQTSIIPTPTLEPLSTPTPTPVNKTADWKNYTGQGISFKYPPILVEQPYQTYGGGIIPEQHFINYQAKETLWFRVQDNTGVNGQNVYTSLGQICPQCLNATTIILDRQQAVSVGASVFFFGPDKSKWYDFKLDGPDINKNISTFNQILSTFHFTNQTNQTPTCRPRPACLDATPRCLIPETADMCPRTSP